MGQKLSTGARKLESMDGMDGMITHPSSSSLGTTISTLHVGSTCTVICCRSSSTRASSWGLEATGCHAQFPSSPHLHFPGTPTEFHWAGANVSPQCGVGVLRCCLWEPSDQHPTLAQLRQGPSGCHAHLGALRGQQLTVHLGVLGLWRQQGHKE